MAITLRTQSIGCESVIFIGPASLVASKSQPDHWYIVESGRCSCPGFTYRGTCRHLAPAQEAAELDRQASAPAVLTHDEPVPSNVVPIIPAVYEECIVFERECTQCQATIRRGVHSEHGLCRLCAAQDRESAEPACAAPQHSYPGRHGLYGVARICRECQASYRGPRWSTTCYPCYQQRVGSS